MFRSKVFRFATAVVCLASTSFSDDQGVSIADCRYANNPQEFLGRQARIFRQTNQRIARLSGSARLSSVGSHAVSSGSVPRRNFIDQEIFGRLAAANVASAPVSSDTEFLRRITLDLTGRLPEPDAVRAFLADTSDGKRDALIERLLSAPEFNEKWTQWMGDLLQNTATLTNAAINRSAGGRNAFHAYIKDAVSRDKSLSVIATEVITGRGNNFDMASGAANFPLGASTSMGPVQDTYDTMLAKTTATFLGISSYDCLLCHTGRGHLDQLSLWGKSRSRMEAESMAAFFSRMVFTPNPDKSIMVSEAPSGGYDLNTYDGNRPVRLPVAGLTSLTPAYRETGATPDNDDWRGAFAKNLVKDPMFARNLANRLWRQMFGLALVEPVDSLDPARLDPANPPDDPWTLQATHPELLEKLAAELGRQNFQLRGFLRQLVQSSAYQLSSNYGGEWKDDYLTLFARHYPRRMEGEEVHDAIARATGVPGGYTIAGWSEPVQWAMQLPEPVEPASNAAVNRFMNTFLRGDRDTQDRSQAGSIQQQLSLMNDAFVLNRVKLVRSPKLQTLASLPLDADVVNGIYLAFLSRLPSEEERAYAVSALQKAGPGTNFTAPPPPDNDRVLTLSGVVTPAIAPSRDNVVEDLAWMCINKVEFLFSY